MPKKVAHHGVRVRRLKPRMVLGLVHQTSGEPLAIAYGVQPGRTGPRLYFSNCECCECREGFEADMIEALGSRHYSSAPVSAVDALISGKGRRRLFSTGRYHTEVSGDDVHIGCRIFKMDELKKSWSTMKRRYRLRRPR